MFKIYICRCESCLACSLPSQHTKFHPKALGIFHSCSFLSNMSDNCRLLVMKNIFEIIDAHKCRHEKQQKPTSQPAQCATFTHAAALGCAPMNIISLQHTREGHSTGRNLCVCAVCCVHMVTPCDGIGVDMAWRHSGRPFGTGQTSTISYCSRSWNVACLLKCEKTKTFQWLLKTKCILWIHQILRQLSYVTYTW